MIVREVKGERGEGEWVVWRDGMGWSGGGGRVSTHQQEINRNKDCVAGGQGAEGAWAAAARGGYRKRSTAVRAKVLKEIRRQGVDRREG